MNVLIVHAHPEPKSFVSAMRTAAVEELCANGHSVVVSDLYEMGFNPVASAADFSAPERSDYLNYALEQRHAVRQGTLAPDIAAEVEKLLAADLLILNFPLYWFSVPAILKGWIDRVLLSGLCYGGKRFYDRGGLAGKRMLASLALGGREHMFGVDAIHGEIETLLRPLLRGTFYYTGGTVLPPFVAWHVPYVTDDVRRDYLQRYRTYLAEIEHATPLVFPRLDQFDDRLYPKATGTVT